MRLSRALAGVVCSVESELWRFVRSERRSQHGGKSLGATVVGSGRVKLRAVLHNRTKNAADVSLPIPRFNLQS